ncbi:MAG: prepilin-type N-terminal cleavage/methylation domain-containing protein [Planctomycetes bacterium]|nr:prepilin-type N-terminal cleavage/methylation domain-containing protein [Planctomycetota bacterium]
MNFPLLQRRARSARDFTLLELVVVVGILASLATLAVAMIDGVSRDAQISTDMSNQARIRSSMGIYYATHNNTYPEGWDSLLDQQSLATSPRVYWGVDTDGSGANDKGDTNQGMFGQVRGWGAGSPRRRACVALMSSDQREAFSRIDIRTLYDHDSQDVTVSPNDSSNTPAMLAAVRTMANTGTYIAIVDPRHSIGQTVYRNLGQALPNPLPTSATWATNTPLDLAAVDPTPLGTGTGTIKVPGMNFVLVTLGLGPHSELLGDARGGLERPPSSDRVKNVFYSNYIVVFKMPLGTKTDPQVVGILNARGETIDLQQDALDSSS